MPLIATPYRDKTFGLCFIDHIVRLQLLSNAERLTAIDPGPGPGGCGQRADVLSGGGAGGRMKYLAASVVDNFAGHMDCARGGPFSPQRVQAAIFVISIGGSVHSFPSPSYTLQAGTDA